MYLNSISKINEQAIHPRPLNNERGTLAKG